MDSRRSNTTPFQTNTLVSVLPNQVTVRHFLEMAHQAFPHTSLEPIYGYDNPSLDKSFASQDLTRPSFALTGYFKHFPSYTLQLLGETEVSYICTLQTPAQMAQIDTYLSMPIPGIIVAARSELPSFFIEKAHNNGIPIIISGTRTRFLMPALYALLGDIFAPQCTVHGNLAAVFHLGVLICGPSGVGKSEAVVALMEKGHSFVCDDSVHIRRLLAPHGPQLVGKPVRPNLPYLELRGIGIINLTKHFHPSLILPEHAVSLIINLEPWSQSKVYDRLGTEVNYQNVLGVDIPTQTIPIIAGRNTSSLIEVATQKEIMRLRGYNSAVEFQNEILREIHSS